MQPERPRARERQVRFLLGAQLSLLTLAALVFALLPPEKGPVVVLALGHDSPALLLGPSTGLIGKGRFAGSLVISGERPDFWTALTHYKLLLLPALPALCGNAISDRTST